MKSWSIEKILRKFVSVILVLSMVFTSVPAYASWNTDEDPTGNDYDEAIVSALSEVCGDTYDPITVLDRLYSVGVIDESGYPLTTAEFEVDGETLTTDQLIEEAEKHDDSEAVTIDGEETTWGNVNAIMQYVKMIDILQEVCAEDGEMTLEHSKNLYSLLSLFNSSDVLEVEDSANLLSVEADPSWPENTTESGETSSGETWFACSDSDGSGISQTSVVTVSLSKSNVNPGASITATVTLTEAQPVDVTMQYRVVSGSWSKANASGNGTLTWKAGTKGAQTFTITVGNNSNANKTSGTETFVVQVYNMRNATCNSSSNWQQLVYVNQSYDWNSQFTFSKSLGTIASLGNKLTRFGLEQNFEGNACYYNDWDDYCSDDGSATGTWSVSGVPSGKWSYTISLKLSAWISGTTGGGSTGPSSASDSEATVKDKNYTTGVVKIEAEGKSDEIHITQTEEANQLYFGCHSDSESRTITVTGTADSGALNGKSGSVTISRSKAKKDGTGKNKNTTQQAYANATASISATEVTSTGKITSITIPDGTFYPGQYVPITVTTDFPLTVNSGITLKVNGVELHPAESGKSTIFTFYYQVKELDTGTINVQSFGGSITGGNGKTGFTLSNAASAGSIAGTNSNCKLVTPAKTSSFTSTSITIDDELPTKQTVVIDMPISSFSEGGNFPYISWIASNTEILQNKITLKDADGNDVTVAGYVKSMYASYDGGKTRYPLYVAIKTQTVTIYKPDGSSYQTDEFPIKLVCNINPIMNTTATLRQDTIEIFMDPDISSTYDYVATGCTEATDDLGYTYYIKGKDTQDAPALIGSYGKVLVKNGVFLDNDYTYIPSGQAEAVQVSDVSISSGTEFQELLDKTSTTKKFTPENETEEIERKVIELYAQEDVLLNLDYTVYDRPDGSVSKDGFSFLGQKWLKWCSSDPSVATIDENGYICFTGTAGEVYFWLDVTNGYVEQFRYRLYSDVIKVKAGMTPYIQIPRAANSKVVLENDEAYIAYSSNLTDRNKAEKGDSFTTDFTLKLYDYSDVTISADGKTVTLKENAKPVWTTTKASPAEVTAVDGTKSIQPVSSIAIEEGVLAKTKNADYDYVAIVSAKAEATGETLSTYAKIKVQAAPAKVKIAKLESYSVTDTALPTINYTVYNTDEDSEIYYVVQQSGGKTQTSKITNTTSGAIDSGMFTAEAGQLKTIYTVTVYARRSAEDSWSADSLTLTVYDGSALKIIVSEVTRGDLGGYTGGKESEGNVAVSSSATSSITYDKSSDSYTLDNTSYIASLLNGSKDQVIIDGAKVTLEQLQNDLSLQAVVSINYGDYVWGMLSDQIKWSSSDSDAASIDYYQGGMYSDIESYTYPSYLPATDFLVVGHNNGKTTLTATHTIVGMEDSVELTVNTLKDKFYLFQFMPEVKVQINYTNGKGEAKVLYSNDQGQLAVYEPSGIATDVTVLSEDRAYSTSIANADLLSSEQNIAALQLYPVNNAELHNVASAQICVLDVNGNPVKNQTVTVRAGVFRNREYCENAEFRIADDNYKASYNGRADIVMKTDSNGMLNFKLEATQFYVDDPSEADEYTSDIMYIFELNYGDEYYPEIVKLETYSTSDYNTSSPITSTTREKRVGAKSPFVESLEEYQYSYSDGKWTANSYYIDLDDETGSIGPNSRYKQVGLDTTIMLWGYSTVQESKGAYASLPSTITSDSSVVLYSTTDGSVPAGQSTNVIKTEAVTNLNDITGVGETSFYVYPFSSIPLARNGYLMNSENFGATGKTVKYTDEYGEVYDINEYEYLGFMDEMGLEVKLFLNNKNVVDETLEIKASNLLDQQFIEADGSALNQLIEDTDNNLSSSMDLGSVLDEIDMSDFLKLPFKFISGIALELTGGKMNTNIFPTSDPSKFYLLMTPSSLQNPWSDSNAKVTYNQNTRLENATAVLDEMELSGPGGASFEMSFGGYMLLEARYTLSGWKIYSVAGNLNACTGEIGYTFKWNMFVGPVPVNFCIGLGGGVKFNFSYITRTAEGEQNSMDQLIDITLRLYIYLFGGIGVDTSIARLKVGVYGKIGVNIELARLLVERENSTYKGQRVSIDGEVGITFIVGVLLVTYEKILASTKFEIAAWEYNDYAKIMKYWTSGDLSDLQSSVQTFSLQSYEGEDVTLTTYPDGTLTIEVDRAVTQDRNYLNAAERSWVNESLTLYSLFQGDDAENYASKLQTNSYPYANPVYTDDGEIMLYLSDANCSTEAVSSVAWADITDRYNVQDKGTFRNYETTFAGGTSYTKEGDEEIHTLTKETVVNVISYNSTDHSATFTFEGDATVYTATNLRNENKTKVKVYEIADDGSKELASGNVVDSLQASGTDGKYFAAWATHAETVTKEMGSEVNNDDVSLTMQTSEIIVARYDGSKWVEQQLTSDQIGDFAPAIASWGDKAIVVWQRSVSSGTNPLEMNVSNELYYSIWNGSNWSTPKAVGALNGTLKSFDTAMLQDGTAIVSYIIETGDDEDGTTDAESCYSVIGADGEMVTGFARLTNDERTDSNVSVISVVRDGQQQFLMSWLTQIDRDGDEETTTDTYNDLSVAIIGADGNKDPFFIDSIQADEDNSVSNPYVLVASADKDFEDVAVVWTETVPEDDETGEDAYSCMKFVKFYEMDNTQGVTVPVELARMDADVTIDHFDAFVQEDGEVEAVILGSDYSQTLATKSSTVDLSPILTLPGEEGNVLQVSSTEPIRNLYTAYATVDGAAFSAEEAYFNFSDVKAGFPMTIQIPITNTGNEKLTTATVKIGDQDAKTYNINLLPGKTYNLVCQYKVPSENVSDVEYTLTLKADKTKATCKDGSDTGIININRPDIGVGEVTVIREADGQRDIEVILNRSGNIPLEGSGKVVKLAFYNNKAMEDSDMIGSPVTISTDKYSLIDVGVYHYQQTFNVEDLVTLVADEVTGADEMPSDGVTIYVKAWLEEEDGTAVTEVRQANNTGFVAVSSMLERNREDALTEKDDLVSKKVSVEGEDVSIVLQSITMGERTAEDYTRLGNVRATAYDENGDVVGTAETFDFDNPSTEYYIPVGEEETLQLAAQIDLEEEQTTDDITSWDLTLFEERYTTYYTWNNEVTGDKVIIPAGTFTTEENKSVGSYSYAARFVNYGFRTSSPCTPTQGERYFVGWYEVLGYTDGTKTYMIGEDGFTAEDLAKIDFVANPTYCRILASNAFDYENVQIQKDTVLFALFTSLNAVDPDNYDLSLPADKAVKIKGYTDDMLSDDNYILTIELIGDTFTDEFTEGTLLSTNMEGVKVKYLKYLGLNTRKNQIIQVQIVGTPVLGFNGQFIIQPTLEESKYFTLGIPVNSIGTANLTANIKAFFQINYELDNILDTSVVSYGTINSKLNPADYAKDYSGYTYTDGTTGVKISEDKTSQITLNYASNVYAISYNQGSLAVDSKTKASIGSITGYTASGKAVYDQEAQLAQCGYSYSGYVFVGWNTAADGSGVTYAAGSTVKNLTETDSVTLYAQWVAEGDESYTVEYYFQQYVDGVASYVLDESKTEEIGGVQYKAIVKAAAKSFEGYEFSKDCGLNNVSGKVLKNGKTTFQLYYDLEKVQVNFYAVGATGGFTASYAPGSVITVPGNSEITYPGYKLVSWNTKADGSGETLKLYASGSEEAASLTITKDVSYYAVFEEAEYTVKFDANADAGDVVSFSGDATYTASGNVRSYTGKYGETIFIPTVTRTVDGVEQKFLGWYTSTDPTKAEAATNRIPDSDVTYYAIWDTEYTVKYIFQDIASTGSKTAAWDTSLTQVVKLWGKAGELTKAKAIDVEGFTATKFKQQEIGDNTVVEIYYTRNMYTVSFNAWGGKLSTGKSSVSTKMAYGAEIVAPAAPTRDRYIFTGWNSEIAETVPAKNVSYTAKWTKKAYVASGIISNLVDGATLTLQLKKGNEVVSSAEFTVSGNSQAYQFSPLASGAYQLVATQVKDGVSCSATMAVVAAGTIEKEANEKVVTASMAMPALKQNASVSIGSVSTEITASGLNELLAAQTNKGENISLVMNIGSDLSEQDTKALTKLVHQDGNQVIARFSLDLNKTSEILDLDGEVIAITDSEITDTNGKYIELAIPVRYSDTVVYRIHNGIAEIAGVQLTKRYTDEVPPCEGYYFDSDEGVLYAYVEKFSSYALGASAFYSVPSATVVISDDIKNGTVGIADDDSTTVTLAVTPDSGYVLKQITVTEHDGTTHTCTQLGDGTYSFEHDDEIVTVSAEFAIRFTDVAEDAYYKDAVIWAYRNGVTSGTNKEETIFNPSETVTRAQIVTFLWRAAGSPEPKAETSGFSDVVSGSYYEKAVIWATEQGITKGVTATSFAPNQAVTRAQAVTFLARMQGVSDGFGDYYNKFTDVSASKYYSNAVAWAVAKGITSGKTETTFEPDASCSRAQIVTFIYRCLGK